MNFSPFFYTSLLIFFLTFNAVILYFNYLLKLKQWLYSHSSNVMVEHQCCNAANLVGYVFEPSMLAASLNKTTLRAGSWENVAHRCVSHHRKLVCCRCCAEGWPLHSHIMSGKIKNGCNMHIQGPCDFNIMVGHWSPSILLYFFY